MTAREQMQLVMHVNIIFDPRHITEETGCNDSFLHSVTILVHQHLRSGHIYQSKPTIEVVSPIPQGYW